MSGQEAVLFEVRDHIGVITFNRPDTMNALNAAMQERIAAIMDQMRTDTDVRVLIMTGSGRGFCAGADMGGLAARVDGTAAEARWQPPRNDRDVALLMRACDKPIIGAINGYAVGWGLGLALATDVRIASEEAKMGAYWTRRGLMGDGGGTYCLPRILGASRACEMIFTGALYDAAACERAGLVSRVVPHDQLMPAAMELAGRIAAMPPLAVALDKRAIYRALDVSLQEALAYEHVYQQRLFLTEDFKEGVRAFHEKREPHFAGR
jgi:enoyl-CoA hydratase/carnithine racemase